MLGGARSPFVICHILSGAPDGGVLALPYRQVKRYFEYEDPDGTVNEVWRQVSSKLPLIKLMINRDKRLVKRELTEPDCSCLCSNQTGIHTTL